MKRILTFSAILFLSIPVILSQQWAGSSSTTGDIYRTGNIGLGTSDPAYKIEIVNGSTGFVTLYETDTIGIGDHLFKLYNKLGQAFSVNSYRIKQGDLTTDLGVNYSINGENGIYQYARVGTFKAPMIRLDATSGSISIFGENGTGSNFRRIDNTLNLGVHIANNGYVGIGTSSPEASLHVNGASLMEGGFVSGNTSDVQADLYCDNLYERSDSNLKKDIALLDNSRVEQINNKFG